MIYEFRCGECHKVSEVWMKMSDPNPTQCPACGSSKFERIISNTSFALKGSGWYTTDYKKSSPPPPTSTPATSTTPAADKKETQADSSSAQTTTPTNCGQNAAAPCGSGACTKPN